MDLRHIRAFLSFVDHGTLTRAAQALGVSQPSLSRTLRDLQDQLGTPLLMPNGRRLETTRAGEAAIGPMHAVLTATASIQAVVKQASAPATLRVATARSLLPVLYDTINAMMQDFPGLRVQTLTASTHEHMANLILSKEIDVGFCLAQHFSSELRVSQVKPVELVLISPFGTSLPPLVRLEDLNNLAMICLPPSLDRTQLFERIFHGTTVRPRIVLETDDTGSFVPSVNAGIGSTLVWKAAAERMTDVEVRRFDPPLTTRIGFAHAMRPNEVAQRFLRASAQSRSSGRKADKRAEARRLS